MRRAEELIDEPVNVLGSRLEPCGRDPVAGFFRDGCCNTGPSDRGSHTVCAEMTEAFLAFSRRQGNDLSTPIPAFGFPGLAPGDCWCVCAARWQEAYDAGVAPPVRLTATHEKALDLIALEVLLETAVDAPL